MIRAGILAAVVFWGAATLLPFEVSASIVLRLMAVNPAKDRPQKAIVKSYLPREVKPGDVISKGDLEMIFDTQQGAYYVYGEIELRPAEVTEIAIEINDVWVIPDEEIASLKNESAKMAELLKGSDFAERVAFLRHNIDARLTEIAESQKYEPANPEQHISVYRENLKLIEAVKADLSLIRGLMAQARPLSTGAVWLMILVIVIFLGILGTTFYFIWYRQMRASTPETVFNVPPEDSGSGSPAPGESKV